MYCGSQEGMGQGSLIYIFAGAIVAGAAARIYARIVYGNPGTAGTIPIVIEVLLPILIVLLRYQVVKEVKASPK